MPQAQVIDLNPKPRSELTVLERTLGAFANQAYENSRDNQDIDRLSSIYNQYRQGNQNPSDMLFNIQTARGVSPTARANAASEYLQLQKNTHEMQKDLKAEERKQKGVAALRRAGASENHVALYEASSQGGETEVVKDVLEDRKRKNPVDRLSKENEQIEDFDAGLVPKERVKRQDDRFAKQTPLLIENSEKISSLENTGRSLDLMQELNNNGKVGTGLSKLNINPKTGDLFIPEFASAEEQLFVKTVNDFTVNAKDSFGARVTNFELDRFMQRLPTLANSVEGRQLIIRQMKLINQLNALEKVALQETFDEYGVRNIDFADAEKKARDKIKGPKEELTKQYHTIESLAKEEEENTNKAIKGRTRAGFTAMISPKGTIKQYADRNVENLLEKGYKKL